MINSEAAIGWNGSQDNKKWRIKAIPRMIKAGNA